MWSGSNTESMVDIWNFQEGESFHPGVWDYAANWGSGASIH